MEQEINEWKTFDDFEIKDIIKNNEKLYYADDGINECIIKEEDIPDFIIKINRIQGETANLKMYEVDNPSFDPVLTTYGRFLNTIKPELRVKIIDRLVKLQRNEEDIKDFKIIDEDDFERIQNQLERENPKITIMDIESDLEELDTEYREVLAESLVELNYLSDTPLNLEYGTEKQQKELDRVYNKPLKSKQLEKIINKISEKMQGDFQYDSYKDIERYYLNIAKDMKLAEKRNKEAR